MGAGVEICTGIDAVPPNGTFSVVGRLSTCGETSTASVPSAYPVAFPRTVVVPDDTPSSPIWPVVAPAEMNTVPGDCTPTIAGLSEVTVTVTPLSPAGVDSVTWRSAVPPSAILFAPTSASRIVGFWNTAVAWNTTGVSPVTVAVAVWSCVPVPSVHEVCAWPAASVGPLVGVTEPCETVQLTVRSGTPLPY